MKSLPAPLLDSLSFINEFDKHSFQEAHETPAATSIRLHPAKTAELDFKHAAVVPWCPDGKYLSDRPLFTLDPLFHAGAYYVQEASSMFLDHILKYLFPERDPLRVLDLCAAPGGKSTLLSSFLSNDSLLISNEVIRTRASILEENITRWGYSNNWITSNDPKEFQKINGYFDLVVVDAPCSGSGLFRKDVKALENWTQANVELCAARQRRILSDVWGSLKENGVLVYSTCSYSPEENEHVVDWLGEEFEVSSVSIPLRENWNIVTTQTSKNGFSCYRFFPDRVRGEGFFITAIRKNSATPSPKLPKGKPASNEKIPPLAATVLKEGNWAFLETEDGWQAIRKSHESDLQLLKSHLYFKKTGITIGKFTTKEWIPDHEVAMSIEKNETLPAIEVDKETALRFLKKEDIGSKELSKGWYLVTYKGLSLGWIKSIGSRSNNYLPKHWRIRMELPAEDQA